MNHPPHPPVTGLRLTGHRVMTHYHRHAGLQPQEHRTRFSWQRRWKRTDPTEDLKRLAPRPWPGLGDNSKLHSPEENLIAQRRCRQLIEGGYSAVDW